MFRVYDKEKKEWIKDGIYLSPNPNSDLYILKKNIFGINKLSLASSVRYIVHKSTDMHDTNGFLVYEGDIVEARVDENKIIRGIVSFVNDICSYVILCFDEDEYFTIGEKLSEYIEVVGNVFDENVIDKI